MQIKSHLNYLHIAPRKTRLVAGLIRGMDLGRAERELEHAHNRAALPILKLLRSAQAGAKFSYQLQKEQLYVKSITVDSGPMLKRSRPRAFGRSAPVRKKTSHITLIVEAKKGFESASAQRSRAREKPIVRDAMREDMKKEIMRRPPDQREEREVPQARPKKGFLQRVFKRKAI